MPRPYRSRPRLACNRHRNVHARRDRRLVEILVEIEDRIGRAGLRARMAGSKLLTVSRMTSKPTPTSTTISSWLSTRSVVRINECSGRHILPSVAIDVSIRRFAHEQQAERQCLREGGGKQRFKSRRAVACGLWMRVEHLTEFVANGLQRRASMRRLGEFREPIRDDASDESRGMGQVARQLLRIVGRRGIGKRERSQRRDERPRRRVESTVPRSRRSFRSSALSGTISIESSARRVETREDWKNSKSPRSATI